VQVRYVSSLPFPLASKCRFTTASTTIHIRQPTPLVCFAFACDCVAVPRLIGCRGGGDDVPSGLSRGRLGTLGLDLSYSDGSQVIPQYRPAHRSGNPSGFPPLWRRVISVSPVATDTAQTGLPGYRFCHVFSERYGRIDLEDQSADRQPGALSLKDVLKIAVNTIQRRRT
jgi:hypothetical protein